MTFGCGKQRHKGKLMKYRRNKSGCDIERHRKGKVVKKKVAQEIVSPVVKRLYTIKEASVYLGRPVSGVRTLLWKGLLPYIQTGRVQYIDVRDIDGYVEANKKRMF